MLLMDRAWLEPPDFVTLTRTAASSLQFQLPANGVVLEEIERPMSFTPSPRPGRSPEA
jgi:hypothetical protein